jgi:glycosyltransferase involved in cell wall biosynthesis
VSPRVSVIMPVYNGSRYVTQAIDSILAQTYRDFEFLVLDDGSTDDTLRILRLYEALDSRVHVFARPNAGVVAARNQLISLANGSLLALMDHDDIAVPQRLERQVVEFDKSADLVALGTYAQVIDPEGEVLGLGTPPTAHEEIDRVLMTLSGGWHICNPTAMMKADAVRLVGCYNQDVASSEDADLFLRLAEVGRLANLPEVLLSYRVHLGSLSHQATVFQRQRHAQAVVWASRRRGLPEPVLAPAPELRDLSARPSRTHVMWAWWAIDSGHLRTARKHALVAVRRAPLDLESWRVAYCAVRGTRR